MAALDPNTGEGRAFEIIESLGRLMWTVDRAALVFCIDQVEDLRFFGDYPERFQKAARDLIQVANRVPTSIVLVSCLGDFYGKVREGLAQSYVDRIEKAGPVPLIETRTAEEARLIIAKRLAHDDGNGPLGDPDLDFGPQFYEEFAASRRGASWSWPRRACASRRAAMRRRRAEEKHPASYPRWPRRWASASPRRRRRRATPPRSTSATCGNASWPSRRRRSRPTTRACSTC